MKDIRTQIDIRWSVLFVLAFATCLRAQASAELTPCAPETVGLSGPRLDGIGELVYPEIAAGRLPGCVVLIGRHGRIAWDRAYGHRALEPEPEPMTVDTVFDLASITKPVATATSIMILVERGRVRLRDAVAHYLPEFGMNGKEKITIEHLLTHQGGLIADNPLSDYANGWAQAWPAICDLAPRTPPGEAFRYTDVGFIVLAEVVRRVSGQDLDAFLREQVLEPLDMRESGFRPAADLRARAAPTEQRDGAWLRGEVHDPRAWALGGVAGHAGLFATAHDLARYAAMMLDGGRSGERRILAARTVDRMTTPLTTSGGLRGLGWDMGSVYSSNRGELFSPRAFGHGGFTGTVLWMDPELDLFVIFLSNRLHPDGEGSVNHLAGRIATLAVGALIDDADPAPEIAAAPHRAPALTGIDVLERDGFATLAGRKVGLITNHTGRNRAGVSTALLLQRAERVDLRAIFSPEHGLHGRLDESGIPDGRDPETGLPVFSLYGEHRRPTPERLADLDTLVFDIQDIGARFYTYISTMGEAMRAAAAAGRRFVVLDRPNPIGGDVSGPTNDAGTESFVAWHRMPVRHGMTVGELARWLAAELELGLDVEVVKVEGWRRAAAFDATGLPWVDPSPNMRSLTQAFLYPGIGLLETTNLSVGRGTDTPFERIGAPWLDGVALARRLTESRLAGVTFVPIRFTPESSRFAGEECGGVGILLTDRAHFEPVRTGIEIARQLRGLHPAEWEVELMSRLLANQAVLDAISERRPMAAIEALWLDDLASFRARRARFLLYP